MALLFVLVLLAGGLLVFRSMTRREIAASAALFAGIDLVLCLLQLLAPDLLSPLLVPVALIQNWTAVPTSALYHLTGHLPVSALAACLAPFLFGSLRKTVRIKNHMKTRQPGEACALFYFSSSSEREKLSRNVFRK